MDSNQILGISAIVVSLGGVVYTALNHTRVRSVCCGRKIDMSIDIDKTTPPPIRVPQVHQEQGEPS
jgi:hypothetical protein